MPRSHASRLLILASLALLAYLPTVAIPLLEDDYPNIAQAQLFASQGWSGVASHPIFRFRATSYPYLYFLFKVFGINSIPYHVASIGLHLLGAWLLYALGAWTLLGYELSFLAAAFFAVYEGHQEAVMWVSASNELFAFLFGVAALVLWVRFLQAKGAPPLLYGGALAATGLALISKESAVVFPALMLLPVSNRRKVLWLAPFLAMALGVVLLVLGTKDYSFRFQDGSFSLAAPFWRTLPNSLARMFWFWGLLGLAALTALRALSRWRKALAVSFAWMITALLPYSFLTYDTRIPSRQTYLASAAAAWVAGIAFVELSRWAGDSRRALVWAVAAVVIIHNTGYIWTRKYDQFRRRAEPTEQLIALAKRAGGPILVRCFPRPRIVAEDAVRLAVGAERGRLVWSETGLAGRRPAAVYCYPTPAPASAGRNPATR